MKKETEEVIAECKKHKITIVPYILIAIVLLLMGAISAILGNGLASLIPVALAALLIILAYIPLKTDYFVLTQSKLVYHSGLIWSKTESTPLSKIQNISYANGLAGKIFRYHTIVIDNAGTGQSEFVAKHMANACEFVDLVQKTAGI